MTIEAISGEVIHVVIARSMLNQAMPWFASMLGPALGVLLSVLIIEYLLPCLRKKRKEAKEKLEHFYNVAYAFVKIREGFQIDIDGKLHSKNNCGWFHNFQIQGPGNVPYPLAGPVGNDALFFSYMSSNIAYIDNDLIDSFIKYLKCRVPEAVQKGSGCEDQELIRLRREIEELIIKQYNNYKNMIG